jgi:hypothetical protein
MLILLFIGALVVALTLASLGVDARRKEPRALRPNRPLIMRLVRTSGWSAAMLAKQTSSISLNATKRCGGARAHQ